MQLWVLLGQLTVAVWCRVTQRITVSTDARCSSLMSLSSPASATVTVTSLLKVTTQSHGHWSRRRDCRLQHQFPAISAIHEDPGTPNGDMAGAGAVLRVLHSSSQGAAGGDDRQCQGAYNLGSRYRRRL